MGFQPPFAIKVQLPEPPEFDPQGVAPGKPALPLIFEATPRSFGLLPPTGCQQFEKPAPLIYIHRDFLKHEQTTKLLNT